MRGDPRREKRNPRGAECNRLCRTARDNGISGCFGCEKCGHAGRQELKAKKRLVINSHLPTCASRLVPLSPSSIVPLRTATRGSITYTLRGRTQPNAEDYAISQIQSQRFPHASVTEKHQTQREIKRGSLLGTRFHVLTSCHSLPRHGWCPECCRGCHGR